MKSMLILTDFSEAAFRAAEYATHLARSLSINKLILYHAYRTIVNGTDFPVPAPKVDNQLELESLESLAAVQDQLRLMVDQDITYGLVAEDAFLPDRINQFCREKNIDLVVMGISGKSNLENLFMGSNTAQLLKVSEFPVLVVPKTTVIGREIKSIVFSTDLKNISDKASAQLYTFLDALNAEVHVVNVEPQAAEKYSTETKEHITRLHQLLEKYNPAFHYIVGNNVVEGILDFSKQQHVSLIITVPKKHSFLSSIFHKSISKELAYNSQVPLLSLPAIEE